MQQQVAYFITLFVVVRFSTQLQEQRHHTYNNMIIFMAIKLPR